MININVTNTLSPDGSNDVAFTSSLLSKGKRISGIKKLAQSAKTSPKATPLKPFVRKETMKAGKKIQITALSAMRAKVLNDDAVVHEAGLDLFKKSDSEESIGTVDSRDIE